MQAPPNNSDKRHRWPKRPGWSPGPDVQEQGSALVYALVITLVVVISGLALSSRTLGGIFGSVFQQDTRRAREAAELGLTRIIAELNRERNRGLLADNPDSGGFWTATEVAANANNCASTSSPARISTADLNQIRSGGVAGTFTANPIVYVSDDGTLTAEADTTPDQSRATTVRYAYQLVADTTNNSISVPNPTAGPDSNPASATFGQLNQRGTINLRVRGFSYNNGRLAASTTVQEILEVVPKCCGRSLAQFGNDLRSCNQNMGPGFGFIIGVGEQTVGDAKLGGSKSELDDGVNPINPIVCMGSKGVDCPSSAVTIGSTLVDVTYFAKPDSFPDVNTFPPDAKSPSAVPNPGVLQPCKTTGSNTTCPSNPTPSYLGSDAFTRIANDPVTNKSVTIINATNASLSKLPSWCGSLNETINIDNTPTTVTTIHCNVSQLQVSSDITVLTSATRRLKLYFPNEDASVGSKVIEGTGIFKHLNTNTGSGPDSSHSDVNSVKQLQVFGCLESTSSKGCAAPGGDASTQNTQSFVLNGNSSVAGADPLLIFAPIANLTINGGGGTADQFAGVFWANSVRGNGNVEIQVPGSGVSAVLEQYGIIDTKGGGKDKPLTWDYVTRAVRQFRLLPGS